ncbi:hypothetical protein [Nitrobacter sp. TKz-YC02]|uniref:hypothetical protein n=1 Tax=Nitrobacter sp. TKz-YC02 TaxID=3398704 RepID=UPI003CF9831C
MWTPAPVRPAYTLVDAMARYEIDNWRFSVNVTSLFDARYVSGYGRINAMSGACAL